MTKYTFSINNSKNNNNNNTCPFYNKCKSTDYSKMLDDLINADIMEKNSWLNTGKKTIKTCTPIIDYTYTNIDTGDLLSDIHTILDKKEAYEDAYKFFATLNPFGTCPYKMNKLYKIGNDIKFMILIDGILINDKMFFYDDFNNFDIISDFTPKMKKTIATIYTNGLKITIKK